MNPNQYACNVMIAGLMTQLSSPEGIPSVSLWGRDSEDQPTELGFRYGIGAVTFHGINSSVLHTKVLGLAEKGGNFVFFMKGNTFLDAYMV